MLFLFFGIGVSSTRAVITKISGSKISAKSQKGCLEHGEEKNESEDESNKESDNEDSEDERENDNCISHDINSDHTISVKYHTLFYHNELNYLSAIIKQKTPPPEAKV